MKLKILEGNLAIGQWEGGGGASNFPSVIEISDDKRGGNLKYETCFLNNNRLRLMFPKLIFVF